MFKTKGDIRTHYVKGQRGQGHFSVTVAGVIRNGGVKPNIIPEEAELEFFARTPLRAELQVLKAKLVSCFEAAANATGCTVSVTIDLLS